MESVGGNDVAHGARNATTLGVPSYSDVELASFKLYPKSESSNDMIFLRDSRDEGEVYFRGPKCTFLKNYVLNDTTRAKLELVFDTENISYLKFLALHEILNRKTFT